MPLRELEDWLDERNQPSRVLWWLKRLSANDTQANGSHQAGPYIPKSILFAVVPSLRRPDEENPDVWFDMMIDSHHDIRRARAVWYNNRRFGGTRNETRLTGLGGSASALLDPESTGALTVFAFSRESDAQPFECHVWVARDAIEEDTIEEWTGPVEPGQWITYPDLFGMSGQKVDCWLEPDELPPEWLEKFPRGEALVRKAIEMRPENAADVDQRLMVRRDCEFEIYRSLENAVYMPRIRQEFTNVDEFVSVAQPIIQRRRSRGGRSLELHLQTIFREEMMEFASQPVVDSNSRPDFLFPSAAAYEDPSFPSGRLRMLAVKSTIKERWRQVLEEASRIEAKHLLTLQRGVSEAQFTAMRDSGIRLVVPQALHREYGPGIRPYLQTLESFIGEVREQAR